MFEINNLPAAFDDARIAVSLEKANEKKKKAKPAASLVTPARTPGDWQGRKWGDSPLSMPATLYRDSKGSFQKKPFALSLIDQSEGAGSKAIAEFTFDAAAFVEALAKPAATIRLTAMVGSKVTDYVILDSVSLMFL